MIECGLLFMTGDTVSRLFSGSFRRIVDKASVSLISEITRRMKGSKYEKCHSRLPQGDIVFSFATGGDTPCEPP